MKKVLAILLSLVIASAMSVAVFANTLSVDYDLPAVTNGVNLVDAGGTIIGNETGWGDSTTAGRDAAFDGDETTFFDPLGVGDGYCGVQMDKPYILTEIRIMPRSGQLPRFAGALVQGSNDGENWTTILENYLAAEEEYTFYAFTPDNAGDAEWTAQTEGYTMFRYFNETNHGDVAEVELYGVPADGSAATTGPVPYDDADSAAAAIGSATLISHYAEFIEGSSGNNNEGPEMLWDDDVTTKFCTSAFPLYSIIKLDTPCAINGIVMATANDNSSYNGRSPDGWVISGSNDGVNWTPLVSGDSDFFEEEDFTYYAKAIAPTAAYLYYQFEAEGAASGCFQVSEVVLCGQVGEFAAASTTTATAETEAPAVDTTTTTSSPATGDIIAVVAVAATVSLGAAVVLRKKDN